MFDPCSAIVYSANRSMVQDVWVDGVRLLENRRLTTIREGDLGGILAKWKAKMLDVEKELLEK